MGTHPIFESDFDCLTDEEMGDLSMRRPGPSVSRGIYGFVLYLASKLTFALFITWILVPQSWIDYYHIDDFLPSKYWILAFPTWLFICHIHLVDLFCDQRKTCI